jgi:hypothetical protein
MSLQQLPTEKKTAGRAGSLDFLLILATVGVLFAVSVICVYGMFYFKLASLEQLPPQEKAVFMNTMNRGIAPFIIGLILLLGICVPKRLLSVSRLGWFALALSAAAAVLAAWKGITLTLTAVLAASLLLQLVVLGMAVAGSRRLNFAKSGYWVRVGSSLVHLGLILFVLDLLLYRHLFLHLFLFWVTTGTSVLGMLFCFYAPTVAGIFRRLVR